MKNTNIFSLFSLLLISLCAFTLNGADMYRADTRLNIREAPSTYATVAGVLSPGDMVEVEEIVNGWAKINVDGSEVYASAEYLTYDHSTDDSEVVSAFSADSIVMDILNGKGKNNLAAWISIALVISMLLILKINGRWMDSVWIVVCWFLSMSGLISAFYFQDFGIDNFIVYVLVLIPLAYVCYRQYLGYALVMKVAFDDDSANAWENTDRTFIFSAFAGVIYGACSIWDWPLHRYVIIGIIVWYLYLAARYFISASDAGSMSRSLCMLPVVIAANLLIFLLSAVMFGVVLPLLLVLVFFMGGGSGESDEEVLEFQDGRRYTGHYHSSTKFETSAGEIFERDNYLSKEWFHR